MMKAYTRRELLELTPDRYLAAGLTDGSGAAIRALSGDYAIAAATQLLAGQVAPQELAFTTSAFDLAVTLHDGSAAARVSAAVAEALDVVVRMIKQPNNGTLAQWLEDCAAHVRSESDIAALSAHLGAVRVQYAIMAEFAASDDASPSPPPASPSQSG